MLSKLKAKFFAVLSFMRLTDENDKLSITNIMMLVVAYKLKDVQMDSLNTNDLLLAAIPTLNYTAKKAISQIQGKVETVVKELPEDLVAKLKDGNS